MKILFDTNVIISAIITRGVSFDVVKDSIYKHEVFYTPHLLKEIQEVLSTKFPVSNRTTKSVISLIKKYFIKGKTSRTVKKICRDSSDNQVLADVVVNGIEVLITGDKDLLVLKKYKGVRIISPKDYWKL